MDESVSRPGEMQEAMNPGMGSVVRTRSIHSRVFPFGVGLCCPCLPSSLRNIKDWLHLVLLLGVISSIACVVLQIVEITSSDTPCQSFLCIRQWIAAVVLIPSMWDFMKFIGTYDESLQEHQERAEEEVSSLIQEINGQVAEMQDISGKLAESAGDFASSSFNQRRERFERFIFDITRFYNGLYQDDKLVDELRVFIVRWFITFSQSLLDQDTNPSVKGIEEELAQCKTVEDICQKATKRLSMLKMTARITLKTHSVIIAGNPPSRGAIADGSLEDGLAASFTGSFQAAPRSARDMQRKCGVSWITLGRAGFGRQGPRTRDGARTNNHWPVTVGFCCGTITVLSRRHANHLLYFIVDAILLSWELAFASVYTGVLVVANAVCVISTLACFEQIDEIAKLQQKISAYQAKAAKVKEDFDQAKDAWEKVQLLHDLWNYRTMPFLSILGKIHHALDDMDREISHQANTDDRRVEWLKLANESIKALDQKLGPASNWTTIGQAPFDDEWKATVGRQLRGAEQYEDVQKLIQVLPVLTNPLLRQIEESPVGENPVMRPGRPSTASSSSRLPSSSPQPSPKTARRTLPSPPPTGRK